MSKCRYSRSANVNALDNTSTEHDHLMQAPCLTAAAPRQKTLFGCAVVVSRRSSASSRINIVARSLLAGGDAWQKLRSCPAPIRAPAKRQPLPPPRQCFDIAITWHEDEAGAQATCGE